MTPPGIFGSHRKDLRLTGRERLDIMPHFQDFPRQDAGWAKTALFTVNSRKKRPYRLAA